jgi:large subunit ribosomal protein L13Ae
MCNHTQSNVQMLVPLQELEEKRKERAKVSYERRKQLARLRTKAEKVADEKLGSELQILEPLKY